ncbi:nitroreductase family protein [uncultured Xylophilus sp.]|uniref:nitroreductase family protein n=1 Tax=uncultured Xylophilus sp. TaxID=296832 RepID=UPI0025CDDA04|nr:nitroreductase family protein [uncultured Xylophilus sp.]
MSTAAPASAPHDTASAGTADSLLERLQWRYATKKMDPARRVPQEKVDRIVEAARLAPTSSGLQPFEIVVVTDAAVREKIKAIGWNQGQITDGSHLLVFAAWDDYTADRINAMFDYTNEVRGFRNEGWENYRAQLLGSYPQRGAEVNFAHAARQAYIGLGAALIAAAYEEVDSVPMEGFDPDALDSILNLRARGLRSVAILPLGYRANSGDWLANLQKVRRPRDQFVSEV